MGLLSKDGRPRARISKMSMGDKQNAPVFEQKEEESADFWQATFLTPWEYFWKNIFLS